MKGSRTDFHGVGSSTLAKRGERWNALSQQSTEGREKCRCGDVSG